MSGLNLNFEALRDLHDKTNVLLRSPIIQQTLLDHRQGKWVNEVSEASLTMLDLCGTTKDLLLLVKDHLQVLVSLSRRGNFRGQPCGLGTKISAYHLYKKQLKKEILKSLLCLKGMDKKSPKTTMPINQNLVVVIGMLKEVRMAFIFIVESMFSHISIPGKHEESTKRNFVTKLMRARGKNSCGQGKEMRLETLEIGIEDLEVQLECIFRRLIQTRVSLLNILAY